MCVVHLVQLNGQNDIAANGRKLSHLILCVRKQSGILLLQVEAYY